MLRRYQLVSVRAGFKLKLNWLTNIWALGWIKQGRFETYIACHLDACIVHLYYILGEYNLFGVVQQQPNRKRRAELTTNLVAVRGAIRPKRGDSS